LSKFQSNTPPALLILAAGIGSRYGSSKQMDQVGPSGERIIDYSVYDAYGAGFRKFIFVINKNDEKKFNNRIIKSLPEYIKADYVIQNLISDHNMTVNRTNRKKPWGTGHALLSAASKINTPFAVINSDDFYGRKSFELAYNFLVNNERGLTDYAMIGYEIGNTLSDFGGVSRAVCVIDKNFKLREIVERKNIQKNENNIFYLDENKNNYQLFGNEIVSMNMFAFSEYIFMQCEKHFNEFIRKNSTDEEKEFFLPHLVRDLIRNRECEVQVLSTPEKWFGLTFAEDKKTVVQKIKRLVESGKYPSKLW
jgi:UTP-glucose-1-phosphate uridylyltransferase